MFGDGTDARKETPHGSAGAESFARFDRQVGEIVAMLEALGIAGNTFFARLGGREDVASRFSEIGGR
jgi:hypothetical protein